MNVLEPPPPHAGKRLLGILVLMILCAVVPLGLGMAEPRVHRAEVERVIAAPRADVYRQLADVAAWNRWNPEVGPLRPLGRGRFESHPNERTTLVYVLVEARTDDRVVVTLEAMPRKFGTTWTFELADAGAGTRLRMREDGFVESAALRFAMRYLVGYDVALQGLADALQQQYAPRRAQHDASVGATRGTSPP